MGKVVTCVFGMIVLLMSAVVVRAADEQPADTTRQQIQTVVKQFIAEKSAASGTVDIFDAGANKVRNLILMELTDKIDEDGKNFVAHGLFRDKATGDVVAVDMPVEAGNEGFTVTGTKLHNVEQPTAAKADPNKVFTDEEIQAYMKEYVSSQSQITGALTLFDEKANKLRKLELLDLDSQVRRFGVLYISSANFQDKDTNEKLLVDVSVENKSGNLGVQALRIRKVSKPPKKI